MQTRGFQILMALVVLACCRIVHDSMLTTSRAGGEVALRDVDVVEPATTKPTTAPSIEFSAWVDSMLSAPGTIDAAPIVRQAPTTQPGETTRFVTWSVRVPGVLLFDRHVDEDPFRSAGTLPEPAWIDVENVRGSIPGLESFTAGSVASPTSGRDESTSPVQLTDAPALAPPAVSVAADPASLGGVSFPPAQSPPVPGLTGVTGVTGAPPLPVPEPQAPCVFLIIGGMPLIRSWRRFGRAL